MQEDNLVEYRNPGIALPVADALTEVLRRGASTLLQQAVEAEVAEYVAQAGLRLMMLVMEEEAERLIGPTSSAG